MLCYILGVLLLFFIPANCTIISRPKAKIGAPWPDFWCPPLHADQIDTKLYCFTRENNDKTIISFKPTVNQEDLDKCKFSSKRSTVFITHGFQSSGETNWMYDMKDSYLKLVDANLFIVDWGKGAKTVDYFQAVGNTKTVGEEVAEVLKYLIEKQGTDPKKVHLIGHSLGAHISARLAKLNKGAKGPVGRITALDPAQPGFEGENVKIRLDKSDADFVDVVHTDAIPFGGSFGFGYMQPLGHVDFYMNGGRDQPGCCSLTKIDKWFTCSHSRAHKYFLEALKGDCKIWGRRADFPSDTLLGTRHFKLTKKIKSSIKSCSKDTCIPLGLFTEKYSARGVFAVDTKSKSPFCDETKPDTFSAELIDIPTSTSN